MMKTTKKKGRLSGTLIAAVLIAAALVMWFLWQQNSLKVQTVNITSANLPSAFDGMRIVHLSDNHGKQFGEGNERLLQTVAKLRPDLIVLTGDLIDQESQMETVPALAGGLSAIAPTYYVTGNHEWPLHCVSELKQLLSDCGVRVLSNEYELWEKNGATLAVAGVDDPNGPADQKNGMELRADIDADYTVLLSHRNTVFDYAGWGYDLVLCGHGHGGVFRVPLLDKGVLGTDRTFFPACDGGLYGFADGSWCFESRGLGSNTVPFQTFRLFNRPDVPLIILEATE